MRPGLPRFLRSSASVYYTERKPKNENGRGLGMRLVQINYLKTSAMVASSFMKYKPLRLLQTCIKQEMCVWETPSLCLDGNVNILPVPNL